jgi:Tol biopolymer transport system component/DNA-binding winged helix-turn-helix (wHTH) protein
LQGDFLVGHRLVQPRINSVEEDGAVSHLEPKVMQVLVTLAAEPGEVVTREALRAAVWPDVFVGEDVLIRAISEIRRVFHDDARSPRTVQTVPKVGYRLIAEVSPVTSPELTVPYAELEIQSLAISEPDSLPRNDIAGSPRTERFKPLIAYLVVACLLIVIAIAWMALRTKLSAVSYTSHPLTTYSGYQLQPALSPSGNAVAFVWLKPNEHGGHIYIKALNSDEPVRLTSSAGEELSPAWSPDGQSLALIKLSESGSFVEVVPAVGKSERQVYTLPVNSVWQYGGMTWSADGTHLIFPQEEKPGTPSRIVELSLESRSVRPLTSPPAGWDGDWMPSLSPNGKTLSFVRGSERSVRDIYVMDLPNGSPRRVTNDGRLIVGTAWSSNGKSIVFSSNRGGSLALWRVALKDASLERESVGTEDAYAPTISAQGERLVYSHGSASWSIAAVTLNSKSATESEVLASSEQDTAPTVSPNGRQLAFQSWRSGSQEIWTANLDGSAPLQLTTSGVDAGSPAWSPNGHLIAFDGRPDAFAHIYIMDATGGTPRKLGGGDFNDIVPSWSTDGKVIYFGSNRSGSWQIWKTSADGGSQAVEVTVGGGMVAKESSDGHWLYFTQFDESGLWETPITGGPEMKISELPPGGSQDYWAPTSAGIFILRNDKAGSNIVLLDPDTRTMKTIYKLQHDPSPFAGLTITPDGKQLLFAQLARAQSHLTLVEHFR